MSSSPRPCSTDGWRVVDPLSPPEAGHDGGRPVQSERPADVLHDLDLGVAGVGEADGLHSALAGEVDAFPEDPPGGEEGPVYALARGGDSVGELPKRFASFGHEAVAP